MPLLVGSLNLPSFLWLWRIAAWSMGAVVLCYVLLAISGGWLWGTRSLKVQRWRWLRLFHICFGTVFLGLIILLSLIGLVGTYGYYGSWGHSWHLGAGLGVVALGLGSAISASRIHPHRPWARPLHLGFNGGLFLGLAAVAWSGWDVVQKYLPHA